MVVSHTQKSKSLTLSFSIMRTITRSSLVFLLLLTIMFLCPTASNSHALCTEENDPACITTKTNSLDTRINVAPVISIALQQAVEIDLTPRSSGTFETATARLQVDTNSTNGFALSISTATTNNSLTNVDTTSHDTIAPLPHPATTDTFPDNTWGYAISNKDESATSFSAVPTTTTNIAGLGEHLRSGQYDLAFGTKINTALSAGSYTNSVLISAVANPITLSTLNQLTYMQDMTTEICQNTKGTDGNSTITPGHEVHRRLIDTRDGKAYWVAKLKDGNCWMTQNLDYDLIAGKVLTPSDTNVSSDYTIKTTTETGVPAYLSGDANTPGTDLNKAQYTERSWNLGDYVLATPLKKEVCETDHVNMPSNQPNTPSDTGSHSVYWSATTYPSSTSAYHPYFHDSFIYPSFSFDRFGGFSVRCLAE